MQSGVVFALKKSPIAVGYYIVKQQFPSIFSLSREQDNVSVGSWPCNSPETEAQREKLSSHFWRLYLCDYVRI